jgi:hypothetical protein
MILYQGDLIKTPKNLFEIKTLELITPGMVLQSLHDQFSMASSAQLATLEYLQNS